MGRAVMERVYRFGSFTLDESARELRRDGNLVAMPPKVLLTLLALVQAEGRVIPKAELLRTVWPDTYVEENALAQIVWALRKQLALEGAGENAIETVTRVGYRFCLAVTVDGADNGENAFRADEALPEAEVPSRGGETKKRWGQDAPWRKMAAAGLGVAMVVFAMILLRSKGRPGSAPTEWTLKQITTNDSNHVIGAAAISPDGQSLV